MSRHVNPARAYWLDVATALNAHAGLQVSRRFRAPLEARWESDLAGDNRAELRQCIFEVIPTLTQAEMGNGNADTVVDKLISQARQLAQLRQQRRLHAEPPHRPHTLCAQYLSNDTQAATRMAPPSLSVGAPQVFQHTPEQAPALEQQHFTVPIALPPQTESIYATHLAPAVSPLHGLQTFQEAHEAPPPVRRTWSTRHQPHSIYAPYLGDEGGRSLSKVPIQYDPRARSLFR
ncbi:hypothetical protein JCM10207_006530 [Rhodosporidiobolus poonsookiae]